MKYSKFFYDRPSGQGFKKGLGFELKKRNGGDEWNREPDTAMELPPDFNNLEEYIMTEGGRPFYLNPYLHAALVLCGFAYISFLLIFWVIPGTGMFGFKGKNIQVKLSKVMLY